MARYVDGYLLPIPKKHVKLYRQIAQKAGRVWRDHGAIEYRECVGEDLTTKMGASFSRNLKLRRGETAVFAWIVFKSRAHRDTVNKKVMQDPRIAKMVSQPMPFDMKRMVYSGFTVIVDL